MAGKRGRSDLCSDRPDAPLGRGTKDPSLIKGCFPKAPSLSIKLSVAGGVPRSIRGHSGA